MTPWIFFLCAVSFTIAWIGTLLVRRIALRIGFVDRPGGRKIHANPKALGGGIAIVAALALPMAAALLVVHLFDPPQRWAGLAEHWSGIRQQTPLALALLGAILAIHLVGLWDDARALGPYTKLLAQLAIITALVLPFDALRSLTVIDDTLGAGGVFSILLTILWITAITNAFNFLDNMDGLSAGVAAVCSIAFLIATLTMPDPQWFVAAMLALLIGAALGFLCFNFAPATIFMGDSGSLAIGLMLGVLTVRTTYFPPHEQTLAAAWYAVFAPLIVLAVPLYDLIVVSFLRISRGKSPFVGDTNHLSHRLVARGMSRRTAVLAIYLITATTAAAAILLPHVQTTFHAILIFIQTLLILTVVALLEQHPLPRPPDNS
jgi:UDP-GlcNAc:undecaprenyl-phosphate/decaprenyl-phosphate GlcNAc-1-phosphate transferase